MDLSSMLNDSESISAKTKEKSTLYQLSTSLHYLVAKDSTSNYRSTPTPPPPTSINTLHPKSLLSSPFRPKSEEPKINSPSSKSSLQLNPALTSNPSCWCPKLTLKTAMKSLASNIRSSKRVKLNNGTAEENNTEIQLKTQEIIFRGDEPKVLLEETYDIQSAVPRSFFVMMANRGILHNFVFSYPDHPWFDELYGLRKSAFICMRTEQGELYELHLKPTRDKLVLFGYLIKRTDIVAIIKETVNDLLKHRKLPLVLDLDDTLVRLVGEGNDRYVKEADLPKCRDRVAVLKDGRRVVLTERVHEFLDWAQNLFDISVCSLGDQNYVDNVVNVLDPQRTKIRGILYSARSEHDYIKRSLEPGRPAKDLLALYSFSAVTDKSLGSGYSMPLILDDETRMWPDEQHDNIIEVASQLNTPVWSVSLFPVIRDLLAQIHHEFFRQLDSWYQKCQEAEQNGSVCTRSPPNVTLIYKAYLRNVLKDFIAKGPPSFYHKNNNNNGQAF